MAERLLITGASGYLGRELARRAVRASGTYLSGDPPDELERALRLDVRESEEVASLLRDLRPRAVIHTAYLQGAGEAEAVNVAGSQAVARAAAAVGSRLIHISSDLVFDGALGRPYVEDDEPRPLMDYGRQKLAAERAVAEELPAAVIVRTSLIYGGREPSPHEQLALTAAAGEREVSFFTDELRNPVHVGDLAAALLELLEEERSGLLHLAGADGVSRYEFARLVVEAAGRDPAPLRAGLAADHPEPRPLDCRLASARGAPLLRGVREVLACE